MNERQKEVLQASLSDERAVLDALQRNYTAALADVKRSIKILQANPLTQSKAYQLEYQQALERQITGALDVLQSKNFTTIAEYLQTAYQTAYVGGIYDLHGQGVPVMLPIDEQAMLRTVQKTGDDFKLSRKLGGNTDLLKKQVQDEITRGLAAGSSYAKIARTISDYGEADYNRSARIARTEGHRVQNEARMDCMKGAKAKGADVVKQWDSTLDSRTRESHAQVDGEIREMDDPFSNGLMFPGDPDGEAAEVVNCRCAMLVRARWALDQDELKTLQDRAAFFGLDKTQDFDDFRVKYYSASAVTPSTGSVAGGIARNYGSKLGTGIGQAHYDSLHDLIDAASNDDAKAAWEKFEDQVGVADIHCTRTAYCDRGGNIHIDIDACARGNSYEKPYQTVFHESGHAIDVKARRTVQNPNWGAVHFSAAYDGGKFPDTICQEVDDMVKAAGVKLKAELPNHMTDSQWLYDNGFIDFFTKMRYDANGTWGSSPPKYSKAIAYKAVEKEIKSIPGIARADLSDIVEGATGAKVRAGYGHGKKYWSDRTINGVKDGLATEAFAEMMDSTFANPESLAAIQKYLPKSYAVFGEMMRHLKGVVI